MNYLVKNAEERVSAKGNKYKQLDLETLEGKTFNRVAIFDRHPLYAQAVGGATLEFDLESKEYNGAVSYTVASPKNAPKGNFAPKNAGIAQAQATKQANIEKSQENKQEGIKLSSTFRDATLITLAELSGSPLVAEDFKQRWNYWRDFLMGSFDRPF